MYLAHLETRMWRGKFPIYLKNGFFGLQNFAVSLVGKGKNFFVNFECYDLANGEK
jgi:hypothetical protein